ncbi:MAG: nucleotidyltransferase family protein [Burkholderiaceae bacterium]
MAELPLVIVLASGRGERFLATGGKVHKLQALLAGKTVLQHTLAAVQASGLPYHLEQEAHPGMGDSIAAAVRATQGASAWMILPADLPLIRPETLRLIAAAPPTQEVVIPVYQGQRGHPVRFSKTCGSQLMALSGQQGAVVLVRSRTVTEIQVSDIGCVTDIDTLQDWERALQLLQQHP